MVAIPDTTYTIHHSSVRDRLQTLMQLSKVRGSLASGTWNCPRSYLCDKWFCLIVQSKCSRTGWMGLWAAWLSGRKVRTRSLKRQICPFTLVPVLCFSCNGLQAMGGSTGGWKGWTAISCFPRPCSLTPTPPANPSPSTAPAPSSASIPLSTHKILKQRLKVMHWHRTWHLLCTRV